MFYRTSAGVHIARKIDKMGMWSSDTAEVFFDDVRVPCKNVIGQEGMGFTYQMLQFQEERLWGVANSKLSFPTPTHQTFLFTGTAWRQCLNVSSACVFTSQVRSSQARMCLMSHESNLCVLLQTSRKKKVWHVLEGLLKSSANIFAFLKSSYFLNHIICWKTHGNFSYALFLKFWRPWRKLSKRPLITPDRGRSSVSQFYITRLFTSGWLSCRQKSSCCAPFCIVPQVSLTVS